MNEITSQLALQIAVDLLAHASDLMTLFAKAQQDGRELTMDELDRFVIADNTARANLQTAIDRAKAQQ